MKNQTGRILFAIFLIAVGVLALLDNLKLLPFTLDNNQPFWTVVFAIAGLAFLAVFFSNLRDNWWAVIPGLTLLGLSLLVGYGDALGNLAGGVFLGAIGLSFWIIYFTRREFWWAVIPGGVLLSLCALIAITTNGGETEQSSLLGVGVFFLGMALTFLLVYVLTRQRWAFWPAGILGLMGLGFLTGAGQLFAYLWPAVLLVAGGWLIYRAMRPRLQ